MNQKKRAAIYCRVSTADQTVENQLPDLEALARRHGLEVVRTYQENASAWQAGHQHELARLIKDAGRGQFDYVLVWALDRLSREGPLAILQIFKRLGRYNVKVLSVQEPWTDAPGELGELLLAIAGWVARAESTRRSERTRAGVARARQEGKRIGRPAGSTDKKPRRRRRVIIHED